MARLLSMFRELKMKPVWYYSGKYKCHYKKEVVVYLTVHDDDCYITVATVSAADNTHRYDVSAFVRMLSDDLKAEFASKFKSCVGCSTYCAPGGDVEIDGVVHKGICKKTLVYSVSNPTEEQFKMIEKFIIARRKYIENA